MDIKVLIYILSLFLSFITVFGNISIILLFVIYSNIRKSPRNYLIFSLALSDTLIGIFAIPFVARQNYVGYWPFSPTFCYVHLITDITTTWISISTVMSMAILDATLVNGLAHRIPGSAGKAYSKVNVCVIFALTWIIPIASLVIPVAINPTKFKYYILVRGSNPAIPSPCIPIFPPGFGISYVIVYFYISLVIIIIAYLTMYRKIKGRETFLLSVSRTDTNTNRSVSGILRLGKKEDRNKNRLSSNGLQNMMSRNKAMIRLTLAIVLLTIVCYVPASVIFAVDAVNPVYITDPVFYFGSWLGYIKSAINPILYGLLNPSFKSRIKKLFVKKVHPQTSVVSRSDL